MRNALLMLLSVAFGHTRHPTEHDHAAEEPRDGGHTGAVRREQVVEPVRASRRVSPRTAFPTPHPASFRPW